MGRMDNFVALLIMALVQGVAEWFPISSSGHLVLLSRILRVENSIQTDVAMHFGTLVAVFVYFGRDITAIIEDVLKGRWGSKNARIGGLIVVASIPAAIVGFVFEKYFEVAFSSLLIVMIGFLITAVILVIASLDLRVKKVEKENMGWLRALWIGCAQALAIFPGISRSGSTISAGLLSGLDEGDAMRFSFLLSIPAVFGASIVSIGNNTLPRELVWATLVSFIAGMISIHALLKIVVNSRKNLRWFALYCFLLAAGIGIYLLF